MSGPAGPSPTGAGLAATPISRCRVCGSPHLAPILDLGTQALTGRFPRAGEPDAPAGPLELVRCDPGAAPGACGLVQLRHDYDPGALFGDGYGYRSSVTRSMSTHLGDKAAVLAERVGLRAGDLVLDIGCNDGTLLGAYPVPGLRRVGMDPSAAQFAEQLPAGVELVPELFSARAWRRHCGGERARVVTSIAMFYDLADPLGFMREVREVLAADGVWELELAYLPSMLDTGGYDGICHEHLTYLAVGQLERMAGETGFEIVEIGFNPVNGGSMRLVMAPRGAARTGERAGVEAALAAEAARGLGDPDPYAAFAARARAHRERVRSFFAAVRAGGRRVLGYGASTKGNVVLQYAGLGPEDLPAILERDPRKYGRLTPGTRIPIVSEAEGRARRPDLLLVLPWHFRDEIVARERDFLDGGGRLVFPLPDFEVVGRGGAVEPWTA